jgi:hypothetical protein
MKGMKDEDTNKLFSAEFQWVLPPVITVNEPSSN